MMKAEPWMRDAACRGMDPAIFHPHRGEYEREQEARSVCAGCPVADACLDYALRNREALGIWGGLSERQRRDARRARLEPDNCCRCGEPLSLSKSGRPVKFCDACRRAEHVNASRRTRGAALI